MSIKQMCLVYVFSESYFIGLSFGSFAGWRKVSSGHADKSNSYLVDRLQAYPRSGIPLDDI